MNNEPTFDPQRKAAIRELVVATARESTMRRSRGRRAAVVAVLAVLAVGVSGSVAYALGTGLLAPNATASAIPVPVAVETTPPSPTTSVPAAVTPPTPSTPATPPPDASDTSAWVIGFDGVGPVKLGSSLEDQRRALPTFDDITDPACVGGYLSLQAPNGFTFLLVGGPDTPGAAAAITFGDNGPTPSDAPPTTPKTVEGIGLHSTTQDLLAAYPDIQQTGSYQSDEYPYYGLTDGNGGWIVFGIIDGKVGQIQVANQASLPYENVSVKTLPAERCPA